MIMNFLDDLVNDACAKYVESLVPEQKPVTKIPSKAKLAKGSEVLLVTTAAYTKFLALRNNTSLEWSGYGPITNGGGKHVLHDFYYLSDDDSVGKTNLPPEALAQAWMNVIASGLDPSYVKLAWVHCHPFGGAYWSGTDDRAVTDLVTRNGGVQISVLFHGGVMARLDSPERSESMIVEIDYGQYADDIERASKVECAHAEKLVVIRQLEAARREEAKKNEPPKKDEPPKKRRRRKLPWFMETDEKAVVVSFECGRCMQWIVNDEVGPLTCRSCGDQICTDCMSDTYPNVCKDCEFDVAMVHEQAQKAGPIGFCHVCYDYVSRKGELFCEDCRELFENVEV
jgi:hypothetical protein